MKKSKNVIFSLLGFAVAALLFLFIWAYRYPAVFCSGERIPIFEVSDVKKKALGGDSEAAASLYYHFEGCGFATEEKQKWLKVSAKNGHSNLQFIYGLTLLENGDLSGVEWLIASAENGYSGAQFRMGLFYETGEYVDADLKSAEKFYRAAAVNGDVAAMLSLAKLLIRQRGKVLTPEIKKWLMLVLDRAGPGSVFEEEAKRLLEQ